MKKTAVIVILALLAIAQQAQARPYSKETEQLLERVDSLISQYTNICQQRQQEISRMAAQPKPTTPKRQFERNERLFHEYQFFNLDSAKAYVDANSKIASAMGNPAMQALCHIRKSYLLSAAGQIHESLKEMERVDRSSLKDSLWIEYYGQMSLLYSRFAEYIDVGGKAQMELYQKEYEYADSVLALLPQESPYYYIYRAIKQIYWKQHAQGIAELQGYLATNRKLTIANSQMLYLLAAMFRESKQPEKQLESLAYAAAMDLILCNNDNSSLKDLSDMLYNLGDNERAYNYISMCMAMASKMNNRVRLVNASSVFGKIQKKNSEEKEQRNQMLVVLLWVIGIFTLVLIFVALYLYRVLKQRSRQRKELHLLNDELNSSNMELADTNKQLKESLAEITHLNGQVNEANDQLSEANAQLSALNTQLQEQYALTEKYLTFVLTLCSDYISKLDQYRKNINRKVKTHMYEDLLQQTESPLMVQSELKDFYRTFDNIYLHVYPTFVSDFNALLQPNQQITPKEEGRLNTELRIFALLHLGFTDSGKIADFLHCSTQTVYNNRLRTKQKAINRDDFDEQIRSIGTKKA